MTALLVIVGLLAVDWMFLSPLLAKNRELGDLLDKAQTSREDANRLIKNARRLSTQWDTLTKTTLKRDASDAEGQVLNSVREWAQEARMTLSSVKPERTERDKDFVRITFRATGAGRMSEIGQFLYKIQTARVPVRIVDLQIASRKEATDDLTVQLGIATIYFAPEAEKRSGSSGASKSSAGSAAGGSAGREVTP